MEGASSAKISYDTFAKTLLSPISHDPLFTAIALDPCGHCINENEAIRLYGYTEPTGKCVKLGKQCVTCQAVVQKYYPDPVIRRVSALAYGMEVVTLEKIKKEASCSFTGEWLQEAMTLTPCCHKVNQKSAELLLCNNNDASKKCNICAQPVLGVLKDYIIKDIVNVILAYSQSQNILNEKLSALPVDKQ